MDKRFKDVYDSKTLCKILGSFLKLKWLFRNKREGVWKHYLYNVFLFCSISSMKYAVCTRSIDKYWGLFAICWQILQFDCIILTKFAFFPWFLDEMQFFFSRSFQEICVLSLMNWRNRLFRRLFWNFQYSMSEFSDLWLVFNFWIWLP